MSEVALKNVEVVQILRFHIRLLTNNSQCFFSVMYELLPPSMPRGSRTVFFPKPMLNGTLNPVYLPVVTVNTTFISKFVDLTINRSLKLYV